MSSKYRNGLYFTSAYSNISPPTTSLDMARSNSRDSTSSSNSHSHYQYATTSAYGSHANTHPMSRTSSTHAHPTSIPTSAPMRRSSSSSSSASGWIASPYRSCLTTSYENQPSSYLSDDDLLCLGPSLPVESIPTPQKRRDMTTEEQIEYLRDLQEKHERVVKEDRRHSDSSTNSSSNKKKTVHWEPEVQRKPRRPSIKRRTTAVRRGLGSLNGPV